MKKFITLILLFSVSLVMAGETKKKLTLNLDTQKLEAGKLQTFTEKYKVEGEGTRKRVIGVMVLHAPVEEVWAVLEKWDDMGSMMKSLEYYKTIKVLKPIEQGQVGESLIEGLLKVGLIKILYTLKVKFDRDNLWQEWTMVRDEEIEAYNKNNIPVKRGKGGLKTIEGFEYIEPYGDGSKTIYYYAPIVEVSMPMPAFIERAISKGSMKEYMKAVKKAVEDKKVVKNKN